MDTDARKYEAGTQQLKQRANRLLMVCIVTGIAAFSLFALAFGNTDGGAYGIGAVFLSGCSVYCNYKRREIEQRIMQRS
jgi:hypothetical protein